MLANLSDRPQDRSERDELIFMDEIRRKMLHLVALFIPIGIFWLGKRMALGWLIPITLLAISADLLRVRAVWFNQIIGRIFGPLMRKKELPPVGDPVAINGATWILVSATMLTLIFPVYIACSALGMFMLADAAAALVGRRLGRHYWGSGPRTFEGSLAFFAVWLIALPWIPGITFIEGMVGGTAAVVAEAIPLRLNDNVFVPMIAAISLALIQHFVFGKEIALFL